MDSLAQLEQNVEQLLKQYQELQSQLVDLQEENKQQRQEIINTHADLIELKKQYSKLQTAHTILLGDDAKQQDRIDAKQKITNIILQIDKALELLTH